MLSSVDKKTRGKQVGGCDLVGLRDCICVGCDVAGAISMAFTMSAVKIEVKTFWRYEMLTFRVITLKGLTDVDENVFFHDIA